MAVPVSFLSALLIPKEWAPLGYSVRPKPSPATKVFVASTSEVYGRDTPHSGASFAEQDAITLGPSMRWCYACSKALDEYLARAYHMSKGLPVVVGRAARGPE